MTSQDILELCATPQFRAIIDTLVEQRVKAILGPLVSEHVREQVKVSGYRKRFPERRTEHPPEGFIAYHDAADKYNILPTTIRTMVTLKYIEGRNGLLREASLLNHLRTRANARLLKRVPTHLLDNTAEPATT